MTEAELFPVPSAQLIAIDIGGLPSDDLLDWLREMVLIREFEAACDPLVRAGKIPGNVHPSVGQEAVAVGALRAMAPNDIVAGPHRGHHHALAKGLSPRSVMAELCGKETGCRGGRGGTMHLADLSIGFVGGNGIVGAAVGLATGCALAIQYLGDDRVALAIVGDGGASVGRVWESINLAALWKVPLIVICENNQYAVETNIRRVFAGESIARRASGFGLPASQVDGQDVCATYRAVRAARERARAGDGPSFIEAVTYRYGPHGTGEPVAYRQPGEVESWRETRDPVNRLRLALEQAGFLTEDQFVALMADARTVVEDAVRFAEESPFPDPATATNDVTGLPLNMRGNP